MQFLFHCCSMLLFCGVCYIFFHEFTFVLYSLCHRSSCVYSGVCDEYRGRRGLSISILYYLIKPTLLGLFHYQVSVCTKK